MKAAVVAVKHAVEIDPHIVVPRHLIPQASGATEAYMAELGITRTMLRWLERKGLAVRGYQPRKKEYVPPNYKSRGSRLWEEREVPRWPWVGWRAFRWLMRWKRFRQTVYRRYIHQGYERRWVIVRG